MSETVTEFAPAKVNLTLRVGGPRGDGYHPLQSVTVFADIGDDIMVKPADALGLSVDGANAPELAAEPKNLALKAAYALRAAAQRSELGAEIRLTKRLPVAAGLGGGSADAAACLRALNRLWDLDFSNRQLAEIGTVIGADVPACVFAKPLMMSGIGETITPLMAWPDLYAVIANPGVAVSTADVFKTYDGQKPGALASERAPALAKFGDVIAYLQGSANDLEKPAIALAPQVAECLRALEQFQDAGLVRMSGSGASCFAVFEHKTQADDAANALSDQQPDWWVQSVKLSGVS